MGEGTHCNSPGELGSYYVGPNVRRVLSEGSFLKGPEGSSATHVAWNVGNLIVSEQYVVLPNWLMRK